MAKLKRYAAPNRAAVNLSATLTRDDVTFGDVTRAEFTAGDLALQQLGEILRDSGYRFTTVTPITHTRVNAAAPLWARDLRDIFGWSRPFRQDILPAPMLELMQRAQIIVPSGQGGRSTVRFSTVGDLTLMHSAFPTLADDAVFLGPDTYRFCALIKNVLKNSQNFASLETAAENTAVFRACDLGCGSGAAAIAIAQYHPRAEVIAVDINANALRFTRINAALAKAENIAPCHSNLLKAVAGNFDLIVANPPYLVDPELRTYRHGGDQLGAELSLAMLDAALPRLKRGGTFVLYTGVAMPDGGDDPLLRTVQQRLEKADMRWRYEEIDPDVFGEEVGHGAYRDIERIAAIALSVTRL